MSVQAEPPLHGVRSPDDASAGAWTPERLLALAGVLALVGASVGASWLALRPVPKGAASSPASTSASLAPSPGGGAALSSAPPSPAASVSPAASSSPAAAGAAGTRRLVIPSIGVNASIESVTTDAGGAMDVPRSTSDVAWYSPGPPPGSAAGDTVIDGHLDSTSGPAVFWSLSRVGGGDEIQVVWDGATYRYRVSGIRSVAYNASVPGLFAGTGPPRLSLITCGGTWDTGKQTYLERVIVDAEPAG